MYTTKDYLAVDPWQAVINRINEIYFTELTAYTTELVSLTSVSGTLTKIVVKPNIAQSDRNTMPPVEHTEYLYDRLDLATFFKTPGVANIPSFYLPTTTSKVLKQISELNEIVFTVNDFVEREYDEYSKVYTLKASPKSLRFVGEVSFQFINTTKQQLSSVGNKLEFPLANAIPLGTVSGTMVGQYLTCGFDFTEHRDTLITLRANEVWLDPRKLAAIIADVTGDPWVCKSDTSDYNTAYNTVNGEASVNVVYNGIVLPRYSPRTDIQRVCILRLSELSSNVSGYLLLHYN